jgi:hypothetical protein
MSKRLAPPLITPQLCRGARAMMGWTLEYLAARIGVPRDTLADFEAGNVVTVQTEIQRGLNREFGAASLSFIAPCVRHAGGIVIGWSPAKQDAKR